MTPRDTSDISTDPVVQDSKIATAEAALAESLAAIDSGMEDVLANKGEPFRKAILDIAEELGLDIDRSLDADE